MTAVQTDSAISINISDCLALANAATKLSLRPQHIRHPQAGQYLSSLRGRGMEFDELRLYQAGDDVRAIDWNVTARTGKTHTKLYREERDRPVIFWLDLRPSMFFATRVAFKAVIAARITALLSWAAYRNSDKIGGLLFSATEHTELRPQSGRSGLNHWFKMLTEHPAWQRGQTAKESEDSWQHALQRLTTVTHPGSLVFMLSDFTDTSEKDHAYFRKLAKHNDVTLIQINDIVEQHLPISGNLSLQHQQQTVRLNTQSTKVRKQYEQQYQQQQNKLLALCRKNHMQHLSLFTHDNYIQLLQKTYRNPNKQAK